jgi:hypothetical protein
MMMPENARIPFPKPMGTILEWYVRIFRCSNSCSSIQVFNASQRPTIPLRPPVQMIAPPGGMQPSMRFNSGTLPSGLPNLLISPGVS